MRRMHRTRPGRAILYLLVGLLGGILGGVVAGWMMGRQATGLLTPTGGSPPAAAAQQDITQHRYVVVERDRNVAGRTPRVGKDDRLLNRKTMDNHIKETAEDSADDACKDVIDGGC